MKKLFYGLVSTIFALTLSIAFTFEAKAEDTADEKDPTISEIEKPKWDSAIQKKYSLTDAQMKTLGDSGLNPAQKAKVAGLAQLSGKTIEEILKMRTEQKMGWGKIAKELGVQPGEIGKSVANLRHDISADRQEAKAEARAERQAKRVEKAQEKRAEKGKNH